MQNASPEPASPSPPDLPRETPVEDSAEANRRGSVLSTLVWICGFVVLYVLSLGPVVLAFDRGWLGRNPGVQAALHVAYAPLIYLHEHTPLRAPLEWYVDLWEK